MGGIILLCAFSLLSQRRLTAMITLYQTEALTLSAAAFWQGYAQSEADLYLTGLITLALKALSAAHRAAADRAALQPDPRGGNRDAGGALDDPRASGSSASPCWWCCRAR